MRRKGLKAKGNSPKCANWVIAHSEIDVIDSERRWRGCNRNEAQVQS